MSKGQTSFRVVEDMAEMEMHCLWDDEMNPISPMARTYDPGTKPAEEIYTSVIPSRCMCRWDWALGGKWQYWLHPLFKLKYRYTNCPAKSRGEHE